MASALRSLAADPEAAAAMAGRLLAHVREAYDVDTNAARLVSGYPRTVITRFASGREKRVPVAQ